MNAKQFSEFLCNQTPVYDAIFLRSAFDPYIVPMRRDVRLLPNDKRKLWLQSRGYMKHRLTKKQRKRISNTYSDIEQVMNLRLEQWLSSLPKREQSKQRKIRTCDPKVGGWIGKIELGEFK